MTDQLKQQVLPTIDTQGDTGTASRIKLSAVESSVAVTMPFSVRCRICDEDAYTDATNATIAVDSGYGTVALTTSATKDLDLVSMAADAAGVLTLTDVVVDGETVTLGSRVYEFDTDSSIGGGSIAVDVSGDVTASQGTLTVDVQPTALDSFEIDGSGYVFVADGTEDRVGEISVGADEAAAKVNIVAAIMGTDGIHSAHPTVSMAAFSGDDSVITALTAGVAGDSITTTENFTAVGTVFDAATLGTTTAGGDCSAADAITALAAAVTADGSAEVSAVDGAGDTVDITSLTAGYAGNSLATTETMANGSFAAATLGGAAIVSEIFVNVTDASAETVTLRLGVAGVLGLAMDCHTSSLDITHAAP